MNNRKAAAQVLEEFGFQLCEFDPDACEECKERRPLWFRSDGGYDAREGVYWCRECALALVLACVTEGAAVWIVGKWCDGKPWEFQGVFTTETDARFACKDRDYFYAPATLNEALPDERTEWPGLCYPFCETPPESEGEQCNGTT